MTSTTPVFVIQTPAEPVEEREDFFEIDGTMYTVPKRVPGEVLLEAMEKARYEPDAAVTAWCVETLVGKEGWKALRRPGLNLDPAILQGIMRVCKEKVFGAVEEEGKG